MDPWISATQQCLNDSPSKTPRSQLDKPSFPSRSYQAPALRSALYSQRCPWSLLTPRTRVSLNAPLPRSLSRNRFTKRKWQIAAGWRGGYKASRLTWGCTVFDRENISPGPQRPHPPAETALLSTARRGGAEPLRLPFSPSLYPHLLRNGKWPPFPTAAATTDHLPRKAKL